MLGTQPKTTSMKKKDEAPEEKRERRKTTRYIRCGNCKTVHTVTVTKIGTPMIYCSCGKWIEVQKKRS